MMGKICMEDEPTPKWQTVKELQKLVEALEKGQYGVEAKLDPGSPLVVEDLNPVMKVVTYGDPGVYRQWESRCLRVAKVFRFFRINGWAHMMEQAAYHFESEKERHTIKLQKDRFRR